MSNMYHDKFLKDEDGNLYITPLGIAEEYKKNINNDKKIVDRIMNTIAYKHRHDLNPVMSKKDNARLTVFLDDHKKKLNRELTSNEIMQLSEDFEEMLPTTLSTNSKKSVRSILYNVFMEEKASESYRDDVLDDYKTDNVYQKYIDQLDFNNRISYEEFFDELKASGIHLSNKEELKHALFDIIQNKNNQINKLKFRLDDRDRQLSTIKAQFEKYKKQHP